MNQNKPNLLQNGIVCCLSAGFRLLDNGSGVVARNLLGQFNPESYFIGAGDYSAAQIASYQETIDDFPVTSILAARTQKGRLNNYLFDLELPLARKKLRRLLLQKKSCCLVCIYPTFHFLQLARDVAKDLQIPWLAYLHDTVVETLETTPFSKRARKLQAQTFEEASSILVMSEGMKDFYREKYDLKTTALEHSYHEIIPRNLAQIPAVSPREGALWGGSIYGINNCAVARVARALSQREMSFLLTTRASAQQLEQQGLVGFPIQHTLFPQRADYLAALQTREVLVLALNWPDETTMQAGEMTTIFPTKTIEYLASGRPILVHCPEHYFMARFFEKHGCGLVVSERSETAICDAIEKLRAQNPETQALRANALRAAQIFAPERIGGIFSRHVNAVAQAKWGEKVEID